MLTEYNHIKEWLDSMDIVDYEIHNTGTVTVDGNVDIRRKGLMAIPVQFRIVYGSFYCRFNSLKTLEGSPREVGGGFHCHNNGFKTVPNCDTIINGQLFWE